RLRRTACAVSAPILAELVPDDAADVVKLTVQVWDRSGEDCVPVPDARVIVLSDMVAALHKPTLVVKDAVGAAQAMFKVRPPSPDPCVALLFGSFCDRDCQCSLTLPS